MHTDGHAGMPSWGVAFSAALSLWRWFSSLSSTTSSTRWRTLGHESLGNFLSFENRVPSFHLFRTLCLLFPLETFEVAGI